MNNLGCNNQAPTFLIKQLFSGYVVYPIAGNLTAALQRALPDIFGPDKGGSTDFAHARHCALALLDI